MDIPKCSGKEMLVERKVGGYLKVVCKGCGDSVCIKTGEGVQPIVTDMD